MLVDEVVVARGNGVDQGSIAKVCLGGAVGGRERERGVAVRLSVRQVRREGEGGFEWWP